MKQQRTTKLKWDTVDYTDHSFIHRLKIDKYFRQSVYILAIGYIIMLAIGILFVIVK